MTDQAISHNDPAAARACWKSSWPYAAIFLLALAVRLGYLAAILDQPVTSILLGDAESYDIWAQEIVQQGWLGERTFYQAPFYPYFLAAIYALGARDFILVRVVQLLLGAASCVLLARAGSHFFNEKTGWLAGTLLALYAPALFFDLLIQKAVLGMFFMCSLLYLMGRVSAARHRGRPQPVAWLLTGVVLACFALTRENALILVPVVIAWAAFDFRAAGWRSIAVKCSLVALGLALVFLPVTLRNYVVGGEFVLTTSQMGPNFYIGNSKDADGFYRPLVRDHSDWKFERSDAQNLAEKALQRKLTPNEVSDYWLSKAVSDIQEDPVRWLQLLGKKWLLTWNALEISDSESIYAHYHYSRLLAGFGSLFHFGILGPLACAGVCLTWYARKRLLLLYGVWLCFAASVALFFVFARYRFPMTAVMLLFAAAGLVHIYDLARARRFRALAPGILLALPFAAMINWPMVTRTSLEAPTHFNIGYELEKREQLDLARDYYETALAMDGSNPLVHNNLGVVAMKQQRPEAAVEHFTAAVAAKPDNWNARVNLGIALSQTGRKAEAVQQYERVLAARPDYNPSLYYNIACYHSREGRTAEGMDWLRRAVEHGYNKWDLIREDPDLDNLRQLPEFAELLQRR